MPEPGTELVSRSAVRKQLRRLSRVSVVEGMPISLDAARHVSRFASYGMCIIALEGTIDFASQKTADLHSSKSGTEDGPNKTKNQRESADIWETAWGRRINRSSADEEIDYIIRLIRARAIFISIIRDKVDLITIFGILAIV